MPTVTRTFRVFVSSTFEDLKEERNALAAPGGPFTELTKLCQSFGTRFQAIDLRWGVREEAGHDQRTMEICLGEIERCQRTGIKPNFIILLGDRYGWQPLPARIEAEEFRAVREHIARIADRTLIDDWYQLDTNALPHEFLLKPRTGEFANADLWERLEAPMREALREASQVAGLSSKNLIEYNASATHQEILKGLGTGEDDKKHVFGFFRVRPGADEEEQQLTKLRESLQVELKGNAHTFQLGDMAELCRRVRENLEIVIRAETERFGSYTAVALERKAHNAFARSRRRHFRGREPVLSAVAEYVKDTDPRKLVLHGASGSGKSATMAQAAALATVGSRGAIIIRRFIGATPDSLNGIAVLRGICAEIAQRCGGPSETPAEFHLLANVLQERLRLATATRPLYLFIDSLDQLGQEDASTLAWLPATLPPHCRIVVSTTELPAALRESRLVEVGAWPAEDAHSALSAWLWDAHRTIHDEQRKKVFEAFANYRLPFYLKLAFEEARRWRSFDAPGICVLSPGVEGMIDQLISRLSEETNHGPVLVQRSLRYLTAASLWSGGGQLLAILAEMT